MKNGYNKVTREMVYDVPDEQDLLPEEDWVINPVFSEGTWDVAPDFWLFDGSVISPMTAEEIDAHPQVLGPAKAAKIEELSLACQNSIIGGFQSDALGTTHIYDSELEDQLNLIGSVTATAPDADHPDGHVQYYACRNASTGVKSYVEHTHAQLRQIAADGALVKLYFLQQFAIKKYTVELQTSASAVNAITW